MRLNDIDWKTVEIQKKIKIKSDVILNEVDNLSRKFDDERIEKAALDHAITLRDAESKITKIRR